MTPTVQLSYTTGTSDSNINVHWARHRADEIIESIRPALDALAEQEPKLASLKVTFRPPINQSM